MMHMYIHTYISLNHELILVDALPRSLKPKVVRTSPITTTRSSGLSPRAVAASAFVAIGMFSVLAYAVLKDHTSPV